MPDLNVLILFLRKDNHQEAWKYDKILLAPVSTTLYNAGSVLALVIKEERKGNFHKILESKLFFHQQAF